MGKSKKINQGDSWRILNTEISPYETPFKFSYLNLSAINADKQYSELTKSLIFGKQDLDARPPSFVPYTYIIQKGAGETRELGIIHPHLLKDFVKLYEDFDDLMLSLCSKSRWSLRHPSHVAKTYVPKFVFPENTAENLGGGTEDGVEEEAVFQKHASSYFAYSNHNFLYKFFESRDILDIERKFRFCQKLDIAKFFSNIYTHTISWATKTKSAGKRELNAFTTFDALFDSMIRRANDGETHGILIGPEISRIFAEILLQQVDLDVSKDCDLLLLMDGRDYTIRRYVDDYFVFYNDELALSNVRKAVENRLKHYKLFLNPAKESRVERPFLTDLSVCKNDLRSKIALYFRETSNSTVGSQDLGLFSKIRSVIREHGIEYSLCSAYILSQLYGPLLAVLKGKNIEDLSDIQEFHVCEILQIGFSLFSIDPRFRTSFLLGKMLIFISRKFRSGNYSRGCGISDTISFETRRMLEGFMDRSKDKKLEICSLLMTLKSVPNIHPLPVVLIKSVCLPDRSCMAELNYFLIVILMDFLEASPAYQTLQCQLKILALDKLSQSAMPVKDCESFMLALDLIASPFLNENEKEVLIGRLFEAVFKRNPAPEEMAAVLADLKKGSLFFEWTDGPDLAKFLAKKELAFTY